MNVHIYLLDTVRSSGYTIYSADYESYQRAYDALMSSFLGNGYAVKAGV